MRHSKLQDVLDQLSDLTSAGLSEVKAAVNERLELHLRTLGTNADLTEEEWERLEGRRDGLLSCVKMVRERTGLGLVDSNVDRARVKGRPRTPTLADNVDDNVDDNWGSHALLSARPRGCCDTPTVRDFNNSGRQEGPK